MALSLIGGLAIRDTGSGSMGEVRGGGEGSHDPAKKLFRDTMLPSRVPLFHGGPIMKSLRDYFRGFRSFATPNGRTKGPLLCRPEKGTFDLAAR